MKWLLLLSAVAWVPIRWLAHDTALSRHAAVMGMLCFIGYLILDKLDEWRRT
jgi:hypothetical protein